MTQQTDRKPQAQREQEKESSFDAEIALYEQELGEIVNKMEKTSQRFVAATIASIKRFYFERAKTYVREQYDLTNSLGQERIREMKQQVMQLIAVAPQETQRLLCDGNLWWHKSRGGGWQDHYTQGPPDGLSMAIWALAERLTPILESYGYVKKERTGDRNDEGKDVAARPPVKPKKHGPPQLEWTEDMTKAIDAYKEELGRATFLDSKVQQARKRKAIHTAGMLWDQA